MRLKKLHIIGSILAAGVAITTLSSNSSGVPNVMGHSTVGCGGSGCHGTMSATTVIAVTGLPANGWVPGTTYPLALTVTNSSKVGAGFDMTVNIGTLTGVTTGVMAMGNELHHTTPRAMTSGIATWNFNWTAPATGNTQLTIQIAANAVNLDQFAEGNDFWNTRTINLPRSTTSIATISEGGFSIYPNPAHDQITVTAKAGQNVAINAIAIDGKHVALATEKVAADKFQVNTSTLATGVYMLLLNAEGKTYATRFVKQ